MLGPWCDGDIEEVCIWTLWAAYSKVDGSLLKLPVSLLASLPPPERVLLWHASITSSSWHHHCITSSSWEGATMMCKRYKPLLASQLRHFLLRGRDFDVHTSQAMTSPLALELEGDVVRSLCIAWDAGEEHISGRRAHWSTEEDVEEHRPKKGEKQMKIKQNLQSFFKWRSTMDRGK